MKKTTTKRRVAWVAWILTVTMILPLLFIMPMGVLAEDELCPCTMPVEPPDDCTCGGKTLCGADDCICDDPPTKYDITTTGTTNGTVSRTINGVSVTSAAAGQIISLEARPSSNYEFVSWVIEPNMPDAGPGPIGTFVMPAYSVNITATFRQIPAPTTRTVIIGTATGGTAGASLTSGGAGTGSLSVEPGTTVYISATATTGYTFTSWNVPGSVNLANANSRTTSFTMPSSDVTIRPVFTATSASDTYNFTMNPASPSTWGSGRFRSRATSDAAWPTTWLVESQPIPAGHEVGLNAIITDDETHGFVHWEIVTGSSNTISSFTNDSITNRNRPSNATFKMPEGNVTIRPVFGVLHNITLTTNTPAGASAYGSPSASANGANSITKAATGARVTLTANPATGETFSHWEVVSPTTDFDNAKITNRSSATTAYFDMPNAAVRIQAVYGSTASAKVTGGSGIEIAFTQSGGNVTLEMSTSLVTDLIETAVGNTVALNVAGLEDAIRVNIPVTAVSQIADRSMRLELQMSEGTVLLDTAALRSALSQASSSNTNFSLSLHHPRSSELTTSQRDQLKSGDAVFSVSMLVGSRSITTFDGNATVAVSYSGTSASAVWRLLPTGLIEKVDSTYDASRRIMRFTVSGFSEFLIGSDDRVAYSSDSPFIDVQPQNWFYEDVLYVYNNNLMVGMTPQTFEPATNLSRAMVVTVLYRHAGQPSVANFTNPFVDVRPGLWYTDAIIWAAEYNVVSGTGPGIFSPTVNITRQDFAVILNNYMTMYLRKNPSPVRPLSSFSDQNAIAEYALPAIQTLNRLDILRGDNNRINPRGFATRAEAAAMLHRFVELVG